MSTDLMQSLQQSRASAHHTAPAAGTAGTAGTAVTWLIDNADAYRAMIDACRMARESIWITQLAFEADCVAYVPEDATPVPGEAAETLIVDVLVDAAKSRAVDVRILLNASLLLDTARTMRVHVAAAGADRIRIRGISRFPQLLHAKIVVVDERVAFLIGSPFANGYWDDSQHLPADARRPQRELGGRPLHDLSLQVDGAAALSLGDAFVELWNGADDIVAGDDMPMPVRAISDDGDASLQIVRSAPRPRTVAQPAERTEILPALLAGIRSARRLMYIEHQYLSSIAVIDALAEALERERALELVVVLNQNPDVTAYRGWQNLRLAASGLFEHPRVGLFSLWTAAPIGAGGTLINQVFVHSKVVAVDDRWAMVGSANLDGVSLQTYGDDFSGRLGQRVFRGVRNFDVAAVVTGESEGALSSAVLELRTALWREHLDAPDLDAAATPAGGWLADWRRRAAEHADWVADGAVCDAPRRIILPYSRSSTPQRQLGDAGVTFANEGLVVAFDPSWVQVHLSPNWFLNMFA